MARTSVWRSAFVAGLVAIAGCHEDLTTPGRCPALCPSGEVQLADTALTAPVVWDTSVVGYVRVSEAAFLLLSSLDSLKSIVLMRFQPAPTQWVPTSGDTVKVGTVDSVQIVLRMAKRDTAAKQLRVVLYRLPAQFDTASTYAQMQPYFTAPYVVDTLHIADSVQSGIVSFRLPDTLRAAPADSGVISLGVAIVAATPTAFGVASGNLGTTAPLITYYVRGQPPRDTLKRALSVEPSFGTFRMSPDPGQVIAGELAVGGVPSARATLRLALPPAVIDSNAIVRGTLILNAVRPAVGFARDSFYVEARPMLRDFGIKSILYPDSSIAGYARIHQGQSGLVEVDITSILRLWGTTTGDSLPRMIVLRSLPEGGGLGAAQFSGRTAGAGAPQLRVTYVRRYRFGVP